MFPIEYIITKIEPNGLKTRVLIIVMSNGHEARSVEIIRPLDEDPAQYVNENLYLLWNQALPIPMQNYHAANQRAHDPIINSAIAAIYGVFTSQAEPAVSEIFTAAAEALSDTAKLQEWNRLTVMLQSMNEADYRRFLALMIVINLSKSARG